VPGLVLDELWAVLGGDKTLEFGKVGGRVVGAVFVADFEEEVVVDFVPASVEAAVLQ